MKNVVNNKIKELGNLKDNKEILLEIYSIYLGFLSSMFDLDNIYNEKLFEVSNKVSNLMNVEVSLIVGNYTLIDNVLKNANELVNDDKVLFKKLSIVLKYFLFGYDYYKDSIRENIFKDKKACKILKKLEEIDKNNIQI